MDIRPRSPPGRARVLWGGLGTGDRGDAEQAEPVQTPRLQGGRQEGALRARDGQLTAAARSNAQSDPARSVQSPALSQPHPPPPRPHPLSWLLGGGQGSPRCWDGFPPSGLTLWCPHVTQKQQDRCHRGLHPLCTLLPSPQHPPLPRALENLPYRVHHTWFKSDPTSLGLRLLTCAVGS